MKKFEIDEQRNLLVEQQEAEDRVIEELRSIIDTYDNEKPFAMENPNLCSNFSL